MQTMGKQVPLPPEQDQMLKEGADLTFQRWDPRRQVLFPEELRISGSYLIPNNDFIPEADVEHQGGQRSIFD